ncbi:unnamed protein product [Arabidopsis halleri]
MTNVLHPKLVTPAIITVLINSRPPANERDLAAQDVDLDLILWRRGSQL